jgi:hypothetical protein
VRELLAQVLFQLNDLEREVEYLKDTLKKQEWLAIQRQLEILSLQVARLSMNYYRVEAMDKPRKEFARV